MKNIQTVFGYFFSDWGEESTNRFWAERNWWRTFQLFSTVPLWQVCTVESFSFPFLSAVSVSGPCESQFRRSPCCCRRRQPPSLLEHGRVVHMWQPSLKTLKKERLLFHLPKRCQESWWKLLVLEPCRHALLFCRIDCLGNLDNTRYGQKWLQLRQYSFYITENKVFEYFILVIIFASSIALVSFFLSKEAQADKQVLSTRGQLLCDAFWDKHAGKYGSLIPELKSGDLPCSVLRTSTLTRSRGWNKCCTTWTFSSVPSLLRRCCSSGSPWASRSTSQPCGQYSTSALLWLVSEWNIDFFLFLSGIKSSRWKVKQRMRWLLFFMSIADIKLNLGRHEIPKMWDFVKMWKCQTLSDLGMKLNFTLPSDILARKENNPPPRKTNLLVWASGSFMWIVFCVSIWFRGLTKSTQNYLCRSRCWVWRQRAQGWTSSPLSRRWGRYAHCGRSEQSRAGRVWGWVYLQSAG